MEYQRLLSVYGPPFLVMLGISLLTASLATSHWIECYGEDDLIFHNGIFDKCDKPPCFPDGLSSVVGLCLTAYILYFVGMAVMIHFVLRYHMIETLQHPYICFVLCSLGALLNMSGIFHYRRIYDDFDMEVESDHDYSDMKEESDHYYRYYHRERQENNCSFKYAYSFQMAWVAAICIFCGGLASFPAMKYVLENRNTWSDDEEYTIQHVFSTRQNVVHPTPTAPSNADYLNIIRTLTRENTRIQSQS